MTIFNAFRHNTGPAYYHTEGDLSYFQLFDNAITLASSLRKHGSDPVMIYGHKNRAYLVAYWACILAGRTFVPIESDNHLSRVEAIATKSGATLVLNTTATSLSPELSISAQYVSIDTTLSPSDREQAVTQWSTQAATFNDHDTMYMMFSSGTTGAPKGILVSYANTVDFIGWITDAFPLEGAISGNIRYCFDVSLYELWLAWLHGQSISSLDHHDMVNTRLAIERHRQHGTTTWVSTPSMMAYYLKDRQFSAESLPALSRFIFCGEVLPKPLVERLKHQFPQSSIINTYGPTECTVAVTSIEILAHHLADPRPLPIGRVRPNSQILIDQDTQEILIQGASVGNGYLGAKDEQDRKFTHLMSSRGRRYHTGDLGRMEGDTLYFLGRSDREIKMQGYRVDLNVIEQALHSLPEVEDAFVEPWFRKGQIQALRAFVKAPFALADYADSLVTQLPPYMVPKFWYAIETNQLNFNSKLKRDSVVKHALKQGECFVFHYDPVHY
ncbi:AMP-binding protein (plasmid) [Vibrio lentus]